MHLRCASTSLALTITPLVSFPCQLELSLFGKSLHFILTHSDIDFALFSNARTSLPLPTRQHTPNTRQPFPSDSPTTFDGLQSAVVHCASSRSIPSYPLPTRLPSSPRVIQFTAGLSHSPLVPAY
ncbi:hypothetical protein DFP72DRAFT_400251 [Ephemerocybe angulata]|uniref:Uncharacterized protein n=1 Tax=Ephemerocybe angulata TaxID=980116 RepID=A0A8H6M674_9AGAR|nr:hypothetical protein DFP72DRAFT_400251 [Tulosesus angulatus]